jgi:hypothetical protein
MHDPAIRARTAGNACASGKPNLETPAQTDTRKYGINPEGVLLLASDDDLLFS